MYVYDGSQLNLYKSNITDNNNKPVTRAGSIVYASKSVVNMTGCLYARNYVANHWQAVENSSFIIVDSQIVNNTADEAGIFKLQTGSRFYAEGTTFRNNGATKGGVLDATAALVQWKNCIAENNYASNFGGVMVILCSYQWLHIY